MSANYDVISIFPIYIQLGAIPKPDSRCIVHTCPIGDSACECHINKNINNYVKYFPILLGVRNTDS